MPTLLHFADAMNASDEQEACQAFSDLTGMQALAGAMDEDDAILYVAARADGAVRGFCAYLSEDDAFVVLPEVDGPPFLGAPPHLVNMLDPTLLEPAIRWRRDCLVMAYRRAAEFIGVSHPAWTAYFSETPLAHLANPAHIATVINGAPDGQQMIAITDGTDWRVQQRPVDELGNLRPLWSLEWDSMADALDALRGRSTLSYIAIGPADFRIGMLFSHSGGILAWSPTATHCRTMAALAGAEDSGFSRAALYTQLTAWTQPLVPASQAG